MALSILWYSRWRVQGDVQCIVVFVFFGSGGVVMERGRLGGGAGVVRVGFLDDAQGVGAEARGAGVAGEAERVTMGERRRGETRVGLVGGVGEDAAAAEVEG